MAEWAAGLGQSTTAGKLKENIDYLWINYLSLAVENLKGQLW